MKYYKDYCWKNGIPYGIGEKKESGYKIVADPYRKWISIEKYRESKFEKLVYDSRMMDFRKLTVAEHTAWEKNLVSETEELTQTIIRNQDDRVLYFEKTVISDDRPQECHIYSPQGILLSLHKMSYTCQHHSFDGVTLFDANQHPVMEKKYLIDEATEEFTELIEENWDFSPN